MIGASPLRNGEGMTMLVAHTRQRLGHALLPVTLTFIIKALLKPPSVQRLTTRSF